MFGYAFISIVNYLKLYTYLLMMNFETYPLPQGKIMIAFSDKNLSIGTLHLNPDQSLDKHNRPVLESLHQLQGKCVMRLFDPDEEITLDEGDSIDITPERFHIHSNPSDKPSITLWKASGDITSIIQKIRESSNM